MKMVDSKGEINILRYLVKRGMATKTELRDNVKVDYHYLGRYLAKLEDEGVIKFRFYGKRGIIVLLNKESPKFECIKKLWGEE